jgi:hypothetical protein
LIALAEREVMTMSFKIPTFPLALFLADDGFIYQDAKLITSKAGSFIEYRWSKPNGDETTVRELYAPF